MRLSKKQRFDAIKDAILKNKINSQEGLREVLLKQGIDISQATLSRDLQTIGIIKHKVESSSYYTIPVSTFEKSRVEASVKGIEVSGNMAVIKTLPGHASMLAVLLDSKNLEEVVGTLAGDDTIFVLLRQGVSPEHAKKVLEL